MDTVTQVQIINDVFSVSDNANALYTGITPTILPADNLGMTISLGGKQSLNSTPLNND